jgi:TatD DNase family protein
VIDPPLLIDTHAHLDDPRLCIDLNGLIERAKQAGVVQINAIGTTMVSSRETLEIAAICPEVFASIGIQPNHVAEAEPGDWDVVSALARSRPTKLVGIGETGLDRYWKKTPFEQQIDSFRRHIRLAVELDLPLVIHCREAEADIVEELEAFDHPIQGVLHSFTGDWTQAQEFLALGLHLSIAGMVTFATKSLDALRHAASLIPVDRLVVETDSPYLSPVPFRGKTNEPARVLHTATFLAGLRGVSIDELARATTANARALFRLPECF